MLELLPVKIIVGTILGFLSGLGIGGGSLLILWLTVVLHMDPSSARGINLLFFIPSALIACIFRMRQGTLKLHSVIPAVISGCLAAAGSSWLSTMLDVDVLKKIFSIILISTGIRELFYRPRNAR